MTFGGKHLNFSKFILEKYSNIKITNFCCLNISSEVRLKLGPARHTSTTPKARPEPYTFF